MAVEKGMTIGEVARRTGLSERALRLYESEGLLKPGRSAADRRVYGPGDLEKLSQVRLLKRAGFSLAQIRALTAGKGDLSRFVDAQIEALSREKSAIDEAVGLLSAVKTKLASGASLDAETLCALIRTGETTMTDEQWKKVVDRYYTPEEQAAWREKKMDAFQGFDQASYAKAWEDLSARIEKALPLDPKGEAAQGFLAEWNKLLEPFMKVATPEMAKGAANVWNRMDEWQGDMKSPIAPSVWKFMIEAQKARK
jgi:DNA-binding transcriptional MerR regulator